MPIRLEGRTYYWTAEACQLAGTSKNTFFRWLREGRLLDTELRDRRGWRIFNEDELQALKSEVNRIQKKSRVPERGLMLARPRES